MGFGLGTTVLDMSKIFGSMVVAGRRAASVATPLSKSPMPCAVRAISSSNIRFASTGHHDHHDHGHDHGDGTNGWLFGENVRRFLRR